jgi:poly(3-hydroxybutyrate) depolymerase
MTLRPTVLLLLAVVCWPRLHAAQDTIVDDSAPSGSPAPAPPAPYSDSDFLYQHYVPQTADPQQNGLYYRLYVPPSYAGSGSALHPLVIFHHGDGEKENAYPPRNQKQLSDNGQYNLCAGANQAVFPCFVAMVQAGWWGRDQSGQLTGPGMVAALARRYRIDPDRIIVTGLSGGGGATESWAGQRPEIYAGYVALSAPSPGNPGSYQPMRLATLPGWFFGSTGDGVDVNPSTVRDIRAFGGTPILTVYNSGGHSRTTWNAAYSTPALYRWMAGLRRGQPAQAPVTVAFTAPAASGPFATAAATLTPTGTTVDNRIDGGSAGVSSVSWYTSADAPGLNGETALGPATATGTATWTSDAARALPAGDTYIVATARGSSLHPTQAGLTCYAAVLPVRRTGSASQELDVSCNGGRVASGMRISVPAGGSAGAPTTVTFTIANNGGAALGISGTTITLPSSPNCTATITTALASPIAAGANSTLVVTVTPTVNGLWEFRLAITSNDADEGSFAVNVSGNAGLSPPTNAAPGVSAGPDRAITLPATASLGGSASDDGLPAGSTLACAWSTVSGPGSVTFVNAAQAATTASFSAAGTYVLRLTASDGTLSTSDTVTVTVTAAAVNAAPVVSAGADLAITLPATAALGGSASDDGLPAGSTLVCAWSTVSGPGSVTFANPAQAATTATFSAAGTYVLRLSASDGTLSASDTVTVTVTAAAVNATPVVSAGADLAITLPATAALGGSASDDGLPAGSTLVCAWSTVSGPGSVTFANPAQATTTATFSAAGSYVLRLSASDGTLSTSDTVTVTVVAAAVTGNQSAGSAGSGGTGCGAGALVGLAAALLCLAGFRRRNNVDAEVARL